MPDAEYSEEIEDFEIGAVPINETAVSEAPEIVTTGSSPDGEDSVFEKPVVYSSPSLPASDDIVTLDNLRKVSSAFATGCRKLTDVVNETQLPKNVVQACIKWMSDQGMISVSNDFYCTYDNVNSLMKQLRLCRSCFGGGV